MTLELIVRSGEKSYKLPIFCIEIFFFLAQTTTYSEAACRISTDEVIHPFAFRVHTHALGRVVSGYKVTQDMEWTLLGKVSNCFCIGK